jgi:hypothetical protein
MLTLGCLRFLIVCGPIFCGKVMPVWFSNVLLNAHSFPAAHVTGQRDPKLEFFSLEQNSTLGISFLTSFLGYLFSKWFTTYDLPGQENTTLDKLFAT